MRDLIEEKDHLYGKIKRMAEMHSAEEETLKNELELYKTENRRLSELLREHSNEMLGGGLHSNRAKNDNIETLMHDTEISLMQLFHE